jgi:nitrogen fixation protein NifB
MENRFPFEFHPCWSNNREHLWERIHLPVAPYCNVKCIFCDHKVGSSCHIPKPGAAAKVLTPSEAIKRFCDEVKRRPKLLIAAISGPGEPLANPQTFETLQGIRSIDDKIEFCLSTNGILLSDYVANLVSLRVRTISVSISTLNPNSAARLYEWVLHRGRKFSGRKMGSWIVKRQLKGIQNSIDRGILVKVNSILVPGLNEFELESLAQSLSRIGVNLQNIVPLYPYDNSSELEVPSHDQIRVARERSLLHLRQFTHCHQCRSDVVGIPGNDTIL